jgi:hypothetical protein
MTDGRKACLGFVALFAALALSVVSGIGGWVVGGDLGYGFLAALVPFIVFAGIAVYMFVSIRDYAWFPAVAGGLYAILPDLLLGPADDAVVLGAGVIVYGIMAWRRGRAQLPPK